MPTAFDEKAVGGFVDRNRSRRLAAVCGREERRFRFPRGGGDFYIEISIKIIETSIEKRIRARYNKSARGTKTFCRLRLIRTGVV